MDRETLIADGRQLQEERHAALDPDVLGLIETYASDFGSFVAEVLYGVTWRRETTVDHVDLSLATLASLAVSEDHDRLELEAETAIRTGVPAAAAIEAVLQTGLYAGLPRVTSALAHVSRAFERLDVPPADPGPPLEETTELERQGRERRTSFSGADFYARYPDLVDVAPDLGTIVNRYGWGYLYSRPGLTFKQRILVGIAGLASRGAEADRPLRYFLQNAEVVGWTRREVGDVLVHLAFYRGIPSTLSALTVAAEEWGMATTEGGN